MNTKHKLVSAVIFVFVLSVFCINNLFAARLNTCAPRDSFSVIVRHEAGGYGSHGDYTDPIAITEYTKYYNDFNIPFCIPEDGDEDAEGDGIILLDDIPPFVLPESTYDIPTFVLPESTYIEEVHHLTYASDNLIARDSIEIYEDGELTDCRDIDYLSDENLTLRHTKPKVVPTVPINYTVRLAVFTYNLPSAPPFEPRFDIKDIVIRNLRTGERIAVVQPNKQWDTYAVTFDCNDTPLIQSTAQINYNRPEVSSSNGSQVKADIDQIKGDIVELRTEVNQTENRIIKKVKKTNKIIKSIRRLLKKVLRKNKRSR